MSPANIFTPQLVLGYVAWLLCYRVYIWPRLKSMDRVEAQRAIATLHSFRFFGLAFMVPGVVGHHLPAGFAAFAAYGDLATGVLAILALLTVRATTALLAVRRRFQSGRDGRLVPQLLPRRSGRSSRGGGGTGRHVCDPDNLRAAADDHAFRRVLFVGASCGSTQPISVRAKACQGALKPIANLRPSETTTAAPPHSVTGCNRPRVPRS